MKYLTQYLYTKKCNKNIEHLISQVTHNQLLNKKIGNIVCLSQSMKSAPTKNLIVNSDSPTSV